MPNIFSPESFSPGGNRDIQPDATASKHVNEILALVKRIADEALARGIDHQVELLKWNVANENRAFIRQGGDIQRRFAPPSRQCGRGSFSGHLFGESGDDYTSHAFFPDFGDFDTPQISTCYTRLNRFEVGSRSCKRVVLMAAFRKMPH